MGPHSAWGTHWEIRALCTEVRENGKQENENLKRKEDKDKKKKKEKTTVIVVRGQRFEL